LRPSATSATAKTVAEVLQARYVVDIKAVPKPLPVPKETLGLLKGAAGGKLLAKMKKEAVDCPVMEKTVSFVICFACPNFLRRVTGKVDCRGFPLESQA